MFLGAHVSTSGGIYTALGRVTEMGGDAVQLFTQSPRTWRLTNHDPANFERFKAERGDSGVGLVLCHALYLVNLAATDEAVYEKSIATLVNTLDVGAAIDADGVVFHVGSHLGAGLDAGLARAVPALEQALEHTTETTWLLMENSAGAGGTIGRSLEELQTLFERLGGHRRLGVCLDSAHLYASGYDVTKEEAYDDVLDELDARIGLDRLRALHVNDSKAPLGSNRDRHDNVGEGLMGERLGVFLANPRVQHLGAVLEVPGRDGHGPDAEEVRRLRELHDRWVARS